MVASTAAQAQSAPPLPSSDASDLWLFVADPKANTTFALDTGISIASLMPQGSLAPSNPTGTPLAVLSTAISDANLINAAGINATNDPKLAAYIAGAQGPLEWGLIGINYPTTGSSGTGYKKPGGEILIWDEPGAIQAGLAQTNFGSLQAPASAFNTDLTYLAQSYTAGNGGEVFNWSASTGTAGQVWGGLPSKDGSGSTSMYGASTDQTAGGTFTIGAGAATLYGITGNQTLFQPESYVLASVQLTSAGTLEATPVPLPAAVWLFGSGLLGLVGVGRRRMVTPA
jgi:hypothetical protein